MYTVALGTPDGVITRGGFSRPVPPDPATLRQIAKTTGGEFFEIRNQTRLNAVYEDLASRLGHKKEWRELSFILVGLAALFALGAGAASLLWGPAAPVRRAAIVLGCRALARPARRLGVRGDAAERGGRRREGACRPSSTCARSASTATRARPRAS